MSKTSKTEYQINKFLGQYSFKSEIDWQGIYSLCKFQLKFNVDEIQPAFSPDGLDFSIFSEWYKNGFGSGDIALCDGNLVMIGACNLDTAKIEAVLIEEKISCTRSAVNVEKLSKPSDNEMSLFKKAMFDNELQFDESYQLVIDRYIPSMNDKVSFRNDELYGIGVIRSVSKEENKFELYCYYIYQIKTAKYSMHETIAPLSDYIFQMMTRSEMSKLKNELKKLGKNWNDKLHRVEPIDGKAQIGGKYWYINDKMKMSSEVEGGKSTSHFRYLAGNYFLTQSDCLENLGKMNEILKDFFAR